MSVSNERCITIVIRNRKIVWKVVWIEYYLRLNYLPGDAKETSTQATSAYIKCNTECAGKLEWLKQLYYLYVTSFLEHWYILILLF